MNINSSGTEQKLNRRDFLKLGGVAFAAAFVPSPSFSALMSPVQPEKSVLIYNVHTGESLKAVYWSEGKYHPDVLKDINYILRDFRADKIQTIDMRLLDFLNEIRLRLDTRQYFHVVSGYRSPETNERLRRNRKGVAKNSMHLYGKAVDFRVPKRNLVLVRKAAMGLRYGGVGFYPYSDFVHVDVGRRRSW
ncbi:MAG: YcbK family protein [Nitrospirota bacterium]